MYGVDMWLVVGYKISLDSKSMFGANKKVIAEELAMKKEEYRNSDDINHISTFCQSQQVRLLLYFFNGYIYYSKHHAYNR